MSPSGPASATAAQDKGRAAPTPSRWSAGRTVIIYAALACLLSWAWWLPMIILGQTSSVGQGWPTHLPGLLGPAAAAVIVTAAARGRRGLVTLNRRCPRLRVGWWPWATVPAVAALSLLPMMAERVRSRPRTPSRPSAAARRRAAASRGAAG